MAQIRNSINLTDRMTPVLRSIIKSMDSTLRAMRAIDQQANRGQQSKALRQVERDIQRANNEIIRMRNLTDLETNAARQTGSAWDRVAGSVSNSTRTIGSAIQSLASGIYVVKNLAQQITGLMDTADSARSYVARMGIFNTSDMSNEQLYDKVFATALKTRTDIGETSNLVYKLLMSGAFGQEQESPYQALNMANIINKALVAGGGTAEENRRALLQLNQALASGVLQGDELRSIREQAPYLARMLAEGLGRIDDKYIGTTIGDLKALGAAGELTTSRIVAALSAMTPEIEAAYSAMPRTFGQAMTQMGSLWTYFIHQLSLADGPLARLNDKIWELADGMAGSMATNRGSQEYADGVMDAASSADKATNALDEYNKAFKNIEGVSVDNDVSNSALAATEDALDYNKALDTIEAHDIDTSVQIDADAATEAVDRLNESLSVFDLIAMGINVAVFLIIGAVDLINMAWEALSSNTLLLQTILVTAFIVIAAAAIYAAVSMIIAWVSAAWPLILIVAILGLIVYSLLQAGFTASEIIGAVAGGVSFLAVLIWDVLVAIVSGVTWLAGVIGAIVVALVGGIILAVQGIVQVIMWIVNIIYTVILALWNVLKTIGMSILGGFQFVAGGIVDLIKGAADTVLGILSKVAGAIDAIFGTSFSASVEGWIASVNEAYTTVKGYLDAGKTFEDIGDMWAQFGEDTAYRFTDSGSAWNIYDEIGNVAGGTWDLMQGSYNWGNDLSGDMINGGIVNPMEGWDAGYDWGYDLGANLDNLGGYDWNDLMGNLAGTAGLEDVMNALESGVPVGGGDLDSVGSIKSDVDLSDEDVRLLRDMAAREFLINLNAITPQANITFGDVRETADVNKIMDAIEDMVEEQMATTLVE